MSMFGGPKIEAGDVSGVLNLGNAGRDINISVFQSGAIPPQTRWFATVKPRRDDDFALLRWNARISARIGRDSEFAELIRWATEGEPGAKARLIHGPGGAGKTRLAADLAEALFERGWRVEPLRRDGGAQSLFILKTGLLIVADYPEEHPAAVEKLLAYLAEFTADPDHRIRLLLLSRQGPEVWDDLLHRAGADALFDADPITLQVALETSTPEDQFRSALSGFAEKKATDAPTVTREAFAGWLERNGEYAQPLFLAALALHCIHEPAAGLSLDGSQVMTAVAKREITRAQKEGLGIGLAKDTLPRLLALATVAGGLGELELGRLADPALRLGLPTTGSLIDRLQPTGRVQADARLHPLEPDLPAAAFTTLILAPRPDLAPEWLWAVLSRSLVPDFQRLDRLCYDADARLRLNESASERKLSALLAAMVKDKPERCAVLQDVEGKDLFGHCLAPLLAEIGKGLLVGQASPEERASLLSNHSNRLSDAGDKAGALAAIREAVEIFRPLAHDNPGRFAPDLALSLNNLSNRLSNAGDTKGALTAIHEAVDILRTLARDYPARFAPNLAMSLTNLSSRLSDKGDKAGALVAVQEAVEIFRPLARDNPARFAPDLASILNNLSNHLSDMGDTTGALAAIREAVEIRRRLSRVNPARFAPDLASSLNNLSNRLSDMGDTTGALAAIREAVEINRPLARDNPARFAPDLADSLQNLSISLSYAGDKAGALAAIRETVEIYRPLAHDNPARFAPDLASSLNNLSNRLSDMGDTTGALAAIREAVEIRRCLSRVNPARFAPDLAMSLNNLANRLSGTGDTAGALVAIQEAVEIRRPLARDNPARFAPDLASSLNNLSVFLSDTGDKAGALAMIREAVEINRPLARDNPARFAPVLAGSLASEARLCFNAGEKEAALRLVDEAIALVEPAATAFPESQAGRWLAMMRADRAIFAAP
jgi:tetratricopeptide (TPR) repeat protein